MSSNLVTLPLEDLKATIFVRRSLNEEWINQLMEFYRSTEHNLPPIEVVRDTLEIRDGRHRREALLRLGRKTTLCKLVAPSEKPEFLIQALSANVGGSLPPTRGDVVFVMKQLMLEDLGEKRIRELFAPFYPPSVVRAFLDDAYTEVGRQKMRSALDAIAAGDTTMTDAARKYDVDLDKLQAEISGRKKNSRKHDVTAVKVDITNRARGNSTRNVTAYRHLLRRYEDGEVTYAKVLEVLLHSKRVHIDGAKRIDQWLERLEALKESLTPK